jgi:hypothetical protein
MTLSSRIAGAGARGAPRPPLSIAVSTVKAVASATAPAGDRVLTFRSGSLPSTSGDWEVNAAQPFLNA